MALTWASATSLTSTMLICIGITKGISLLSSIIRNEGLPFRCLFDRGGPRTTQGLIVTILMESSFDECQSLTNLSALYFARPYGFSSIVASSAHVSVVRV